MKIRLKPFLLSILFCLSLTLGLVSQVSLTSFAASVDYPAQLVKISTYDGSRNFNITGFSDNSALNTWISNGEQNENWQLRYVGKNTTGSFYKIVNMGSGRLITPKNYSVTSGSSCVIYGDASHATQHWYITPVSKDARGNNLYYKITNYQDSNMALTYNPSSNTITLSSYTGAQNQQFLLNTAGLEGFAGYGKDTSGNVKASSTGGLLGETVFVSTFDQLKTAVTDNTPRTVVITSNISCPGGYVKDSNGRQVIDRSYRIFIGQNKTIIGSYSGNSLYNVYLNTYPNANYGLGSNIILRNIEFSHDAKLNNDNICDFAYGENLWFDYCTFVGHSAVNTQSLVDWDKFLCVYGNADYVTISDCKFGLHEYGVLLGYPADTDTDMDTYNGKPRTTLAHNYYKDCLTRAPGLLRYGYFHSLNNYVSNFNLGYTIHTCARLYAENCYYEAGTGKGSVVNDNISKLTQLSAGHLALAGPWYTDSGSKLINSTSNFNLANQYSQPCVWRPSTNYSYKTLTADESKTYCTSYSGSQTLASNMKYITYSKTGVPSAYTTAAPATALYGDINKDGNINSIDFALLKKYIIGESTFSTDQLTVADMNKDGSINSLDFALLKKQILSS